MFHAFDITYSLVIIFTLGLITIEFEYILPSVQQSSGGVEGPYPYRGHFCLEYGV